MKTGRYILDASGTPVAEPDLIAWAKWYEQRDRDVRRVAKDCFSVNGISVCVSTVFLGLDHNWGEGPPVLWETMIFGGPLHEEQDRCSGNREQAEAMHARMVERARQP